MPAPNERAIVPKYTLTAGGNAKLLATSDDTTRTVTSLRGLDTEAAALVARDLGELHRLLPFYSRDTDFIDKLTTLGMRGHDLADPRTGHLTVSRLADSPAPTGQAWQNPMFPPAVHIGRVLSAASQLPAASAKALRGELRSILATVDGPIVGVRIGGIEAMNDMNAATWVDQLDREAVAHLLEGSYPECLEVQESIVWFHSQTGGSLDGLAHELLAAEADFYIAFDEKAVVTRLAATRPDLLVAVLEASERDGIDWDDEDLHAFARDTVSALAS
ncbi:hypothetical protein [Paenarthrobacter sp. C1]|uniref:hypothetical protein n=1 Tax=Paenarthrobacter sp. C1 TaxID=3400220 RepID=UPI003BF49853